MNTMAYKVVSVLSGFFLGFILWVIYLANTGQPSVFFDFIAQIPYGDKLGHLCLFGVLALGANFAFKLKTLSIASCNMYIGSLVVLGFALIEELSQFFVLSRTLDITDLIADLVGIVLFSFITLWISRYTHKH